MSNAVKGSNYISGFVALTLLCLFMWAMVDSCVSRTHKTPEQTAAKIAESDSIDAGIYAKQYVEKTLKAPSTAKWPSTLDFAVAPKTDKKGNKIKDVWEVTGYVDAQNSYGAMIRQQWYVKLKKTNGSWVLLDIRM